MNRCTIYRERPAFFRRRKCKISFVRRTAIVLALKHPSGPKFANSPQVQRFLDKSRQVTDSLVFSCWSLFAMFQCFRFPDLRVVMRYMGSGIKSLKEGGIRDHSPRIWDRNPGIRDQRCFSLAQGSGVTKGLHHALLNRVF